MSKNSKIKKIKKKVRFQTILFLALALSTNTFAWFVYNSRVSNNITAEVKAWKIAFENEDNELTETVKFDVETIYPGMNNYEQEIEITNDGEADGMIDYSIESVRILSNTYTKETLSTNDLRLMLKNDYPFKIEVSTSNDTVAAGGGKEKFKLTVVWPYESGDDEADTLWGNESYNFKKANPDTSGIEIIIKISVKQIAPQNN